ncbi:hypothetical protein DL766_007085 [Monosporascus sp. MC13-8B]|uniref:TauD/TfdA-like domain-containing protein n=1 Tax=Monosporascus cannonballus TaxID=155416 RepID=A0ABY0GRH3_9PEZI|nr:hypothetical protein DL762_010123 [Monosporascus cannonballus]RYO89950.1 hypothetical protein DL763_005506 [Monosporascus cannonballus]RYP25366.1 hypothetical protein DL766_007085 [Monosporascus sp. MC13-8B]
MAPSATTTITETVARSKTLEVTHLGTYNVLTPSRYSKETEEAKTGLKAAKHYGHGMDADTSFKDLLLEGVEVTHSTPTIWTDVRGFQLSSLGNTGKDRLTRFVAERKVVPFRTQDFADLPIQVALDHARYSGPHHIHPMSGSPEGHPEVCPVNHREGDRSHETSFDTRTSSVAWQPDVSYEEQPPGSTFLYVLDKPETDGDTLFGDAADAYNRLSLLYQERLHGLKASRSGIE